MKQSKHKEFICWAHLQVPRPQNNSHKFKIKCQQHPAKNAYFRKISHELLQKCQQMSVLNLLAIFI